jgi:HTH-type transcriptional regulator/antitoxin HigA
MTKIRFTQEWVTQVTSDHGDDLVAAGKDVTPLPSEEDILAILQRASQANSVKEMIRRKWFVPTSRDVLDAHASALKDYLYGQHQTAAPLSFATFFRRQPSQRHLEDQIATLAWLRRVADQAAAMDIPPFDRASLDEKAIQRLVHLSAGPTGPNEAIRFLESLGVRVIIENALPGMHTDGVSFILPRQGPVIGLTLRYDRLDNFWFTLLHEVAHIILHLSEDSGDVFVDTIEFEEQFESEIEIEANAFAKDSFIPRDVWNRSNAYRLGSIQSINALSAKLNIHSAIVAGRLRFERKAYTDYSQLLGFGSVRSLLLAE